MFRSVFREEGIEAVESVNERVSPEKTPGGPKSASLWSDETLDSIGKILRPRSIAIVGASPKIDGYSGRFLAAAQRAQPRIKVFPVNPKYEEINGETCYQSVRALPEVPDVVGIAVSYDRVMDIMHESHQKGIRSAVVVSAGFAERGESDRLDLQIELGNFGRVSGLRVCGPNCLGVANILENIWLCAGSLEYMESNRGMKGNVALISQSGAAGFATLLPRAADLGVGLSHVVTTGNEADLDFSDFARYLIDDDQVGVIAGFVEGFKNVRKFVEVARLAAEREKPIVLIKIGRAEQGDRAVRSHTASITGSDEVYEALFSQFGVIRVRDYEELLTVANLLSRSGRPKKRGVALVSHSGGVNSLTADLLGVVGIELPELSSVAQTGINEILGGFGWAANPTDITQVAWREGFRDVLRHLGDEPDVGSLVVASTATEAQASYVIAQRDQGTKPVFYLWTGSRNVDSLPIPQGKGLVMLKEAAIPLLFTPGQLADGLSSYFNYYEWIDQHQDELSATASELTAGQKSIIDELSSLGRRHLSEAESKELLHSWGVTVAKGLLVDNRDDAAREAAKIGFPVVVKLDSPDIAHKTEAGVVCLGLKSEDDVRRAFDEVVLKGKRYASGAEINGVFVGEMIENCLELLVGVTYDVQAGPVLICGMGGVFVEVYSDVSRRLCPVTRKEAGQMLSELRAARLFEGFRGQPKFDKEAVVDVLIQISDLAVSAADFLTEVEINPLMVLPVGAGVRAVDALITLREQQ